ncbi:SDR family oxidoreductase, partial [Sphingomonas sp. SRS2]|uniref:SDR family oxidoreductase n=1 Tax=Sphingomonas sp. SRS2 TaxID=133190 RepID=UPI001F237B4E
PEVEPHHMADDLPRVAETAVKLRTCHLIILSRRGRLWQLDNAHSSNVSGMVREGLPGEVASVSLVANHSVLLIGSGSGLGRGVARGFVQAGAQVTIFDVSAEKVEDAREEFGDILAVQGDCSKVSDLVACRDKIIERHGKLDAVVCFQGIWDGNVPLKDIALDRIDELFRELFDVNVKGSLLAARVFHDLLQESRGALVLTSSNAAYAADGGGGVYSATKGAIKALTHQLAFEFSPYVRVNCVAPTAIGKSELRGPTALGLEGQKQSDIPKDTLLRAYRELSLIADFPEAEDYAWPYMFLASHSNKVMTGQTILADQGSLNRNFITPRSN